MDRSRLRLRARLTIAREITNTVPNNCTIAEAIVARAAPDSPRRGIKSRLAIADVAATATNNGTWTRNCDAAVIAQPRKDVTEPVAPAIINQSRTSTRSAYSPQYILICLLRSHWGRMRRNSVNCAVLSGK